MVHGSDNEPVLNEYCININLAYIIVMVSTYSGQHASPIHVFFGTTSRDPTPRVGRVGVDPYPRLRPSSERMKVSNISGQPERDFPMRASALDGIVRSPTSKPVTAYLRQMISTSHIISSSHLFARGARQRVYI